MKNEDRLTRRGHRARSVTTALFATGVSVALLATPAAAQDGDYQGTFGQLNGSGMSGTVSVSLTGTSAEITVDTSGMVDLVHAQHIHGEFGLDNACPTDALDTDGDGLVNTVEGVPSYGSVKASLVESGPTDESYALAVEAYPVASDGSYSYSRTIDVPQELADNMENMIVVVHGIDLDGSGEYDGEAISSLSPDLPLEATIPAGCATLVAAGATPTGSVAAGAGGTASDDGAPVGTALGLGALAVGGLAVGGFGLTTARRRFQA